MNQSQRNYLQSRIDSIKRKKESEINKKYPTDLSFEKKYALIKAGKVKLKPLSDISHWTNLDNAYDFSAWSPNVTKNAKAKEKLELEVQKTEDKIMLGSEEEAINLLSKTTSMKV